MGIRLIDYDRNSEFIRLEFKDTRGFETLNPGRLKLIYNERESSVFIYGIEPNSVMKTLRKLLSGDGKDDF